MLKKIGRYVQDQNNSVYIPHGLLLVDPVERGLRVVSFVIRVYVECGNATVYNCDCVVNTV